MLTRREEAIQVSTARSVLRTDPGMWRSSQVCADTLAVRSLTRLNCAAFRDDAS
jgi:hypothetical protein